MANLESTIALIKTENSNLICMWCGKDTTGDKTREHIFPECIGGKKNYLLDVFVPTVIMTSATVLIELY